MLLLFMLAIGGIFSFNDTLAQTSDTTGTINFPLSYDDLSLYDFAEVRLETDRTETPPADLVTRNFKPVKNLFEKDSLSFASSVKNVWFKFSIHNNLSTDTSVALVFPHAVNKAVLYKSIKDSLIYIGKTGFSIAVRARAINYEYNRIDLPLKAHTETNCYIQIVRLTSGWMPNMPVLESIARAEMNSFNWEKNVNRPSFLWSHIFTGIFFMFFVFGFIKYLVLERDQAYLYYALLGFFNALLTIAQAEYPPLELPGFENLRGIELFNLINGIAILMQGFFILKILQLKIKYPRIVLALKGFLFSQLLLSIIYTIDWIAGKQFHNVLWSINTLIQFLILLLMFGWVWYLATIREGFFRFIFLGALTLFTATALLFLVRFFNLYYLLPAWFGNDQRGSVNHFMQVALVIDMVFYFTGLAYRDRQVQKDKIIYQEQLIKQLEANKALQDKFTGELQHQVQKKTTELIAQREAYEAEKEAKLLAEFNRKFSESELKALRSQMNPHFVFNILNTIESYALENNKEAASGMIQKFSRLTRLVLENSMNQLVPFENDLKSLKLYIELEQMRYADKFLVCYNIQNQVLEQDYFIPPMIIQPFVENAIVHGLRNKLDDNGILTISACIQNEYIIVEIEDNGIGRTRAAELIKDNPIHKNSLGIKVTQDRISIFNNIIHDRKAKVEILDLQEGTKVAIWLPVTN
jgi:two-component system LytT family sensor kinase